MKEVITYTPDGSSLGFREYVRSVWRYRSFITSYAWAELRQRHLRSQLGIAWLLLNPLLLAATYTLLVVVLRGGENPLDLLAVVTAGLFFFLFFRDAVVNAARSLTGASSLLLASDLPKATLPLAATCQSLVTFAMGLVAYLPIHLVSRRGAGLSLVAAIPLLAISLVFASGLALLLAFAAARLRDLAQFLPYAMRILLYTSPVLFTLEQLQEALPDHLDDVVWVNPMVPFLNAWHTILEGHFPPIYGWLAATGWALGAISWGALFAFRRQHSVGGHL